ARLGCTPKMIPRRGRTRRKASREKGESRADKQGNLKRIFNWSAVGRWSLARSNLRRPESPWPNVAAETRDGSGEGPRPNGPSPGRQPRRPSAGDITSPREKRR